MSAEMELPERLYVVRALSRQALREARFIGREELPPVDIQRENEGGDNVDAT